MSKQPLAKKPKKIQKKMMEEEKGDGQSAETGSDGELGEEENAKEQASDQSKPKGKGEF